MTNTINYNEVESLLTKKFGSIIKETIYSPTDIADLIINNVDYEHNLSIVNGYLVNYYIRGLIKDIKLEVEYDADLADDRYITETIIVFSKC